MQDTLTIIKLDATDTVVNSSSSSYDSSSYSSSSYNTRSFYDEDGDGRSTAFLPLLWPRKPNGAHFSPFEFESTGPSVAVPPPLGRWTGPARGAARQSDGGGSTDDHVEYEAQVS